MVTDANSKRKPVSGIAPPNGAAATAAVHFECDKETVVNGKTDLATVVVSNAEDDKNRYESVSDNGSEISDEGYRSLGLVHGAAQPIGTGPGGQGTGRKGLGNSQHSSEDADTNGKCSGHIVQFPKSPPFSVATFCNSSCSASRYDRFRYPNQPDRG